MHERGSLLRYTCIACLVIILPYTVIPHSLTSLISQCINLKSVKFYLKFDTTFAFYECRSETKFTMHVILESLFSNLIRFVQMLWYPPQPKVLFNQVLGRTSLFPVDISPCLVLSTSCVTAVSTTPSSSVLWFARSCFSAVHVSFRWRRFFII